MDADDHPSDSTGIVPELRLQLADFLDGDPVLPLALLVVVSGPSRGQVVVVDAVPSVIGRSEDADLRIADDTVSRRHAEVRGDRDGLELEDLGSSNGTTLHGNPVVGAITLHDGDLVGLGESTVLVKLLR